MTYKIKSSATRAAKKAHGDDWSSKVTIVEVDGEFDIQMINQTQKAYDEACAEAGRGLTHEEFEAILAAKANPTPPAAPAAPVTPFHEAVTAPKAPAPIPALPAFLIPSPPAAPAVPQVDPETAAIVALVQDSMAAGDAAANAALLNNGRIPHTTCPDCGGEELYLGRVDEASGKTLDEDFIEGCHTCGWEVDIRKTTQEVADRPRTSTVALPTKLVWNVADEMVAAAKAAGQPAPKRKAVIEECVRRGIAYGTARTQYQHWFKCIADQACAPLAVIGKDGAITMTSGR